MDKLWVEQAKQRVLERTKGKNITAVELRRLEISELLDAGITPSKVCAIMDCGPKTIFKIIKLKKEGKSLAPNFGGGRPRVARTEELVAKATALRAANPNISNSEMAKQFGVSPRTVGRALKHKDE